MDTMRAQLDELMGKDRNKLPNEKPKRTLHFTDSEVCKYYICGFCPHHLFTNTKSDLGMFFLFIFHYQTTHSEYKRTM